MKEIKEALSSITPAPWMVKGNEIWTVKTDREDYHTQIVKKTRSVGFENDLNFIAKSPEWIASLLSKVEEMQKTLKWYADPKNNDWKVDSFDDVIQSNVMVDDGERARQALKGVETK